MQMRSSAYWLFACLAVVALAGLPTVAAAKDLVICIRQPGDLAVAACSRAIDSHQYTGRILLQLYTARGVAHLAHGDLDHAMADFNEAIRLDPKEPRAYFDRGLVWERKHRLQEALTDFQMHSQLAPSDPDGPKAVERVLKELSAK